MANDFLDVLTGVKLRFLLIAVSLVLLVPPPALAKDIQGIEVQPAYVDVDITSDRPSSDISITYINHTRHPVTLELFPIDFHQTGSSGAIGFIQNPGEYSYSLSSFLSFETDRIDLAPGQKKVLSLKAENRQDLSPGGHYAAVVAREAQDITTETTVAPAVSTLIYLRKVGGEHFNLSLKALSWPRTFAFSYPSTITVLFQNEGNVHLIPTGRMEVKDMFGRLLYAGNLNEGYLKVLPESTRYLPIYLRQVAPSLPVSINIMHFNGTDSLKKVTYPRTEVFIYMHPLVPVIVGVLVIMWLMKLVRKVKGTSSPKSPLGTSGKSKIDKPKVVRKRNKKQAKR